MRRGWWWDLRQWWWWDLYQWRCPRFWTCRRWAGAERCLSSAPRPPPMSGSLFELVWGQKSWSTMIIDDGSSEHLKGCSKLWFRASVSEWVSRPERPKDEVNAEVQLPKVDEKLLFLEIKCSSTSSLVSSTLAKLPLLSSIVLSKKLLGLYLMNCGLKQTFLSTLCELVLYFMNFFFTLKSAVWSKYLRWCQSCVLSVCANVFWKIPGMQW